MTDPTKKDDKPQANDKAKAVKNAMTGTPDKDATPSPAGKPAESAKPPAKPDAPASAGPAVASAAKPAETGKEPPKPPAASPAAAKPAAATASPPKDPPKGSVPPSAPSSSGSGGKPGAASGDKEPPKGPSGPQGSGAPKGPGTPPPGAAAKAPQPQKPAAKPKKKSGCLGTLVWLLVIVAALGAGAYYTWPYWPDMVKKPVEAKIAEMVPEVQMPEEKAALEDRLAKYDDQLAALESKVAEVADREVLTADDVKALAKAGGGTGGADAAQVSALTARIDALEKALTSVGSTETTETTGANGTAAAVGATAAIGVSVQALSQRVKQLETDVATVAAMEGRVTDMEERALAAPSGEAKAAVVLAVSHLSHAVMRSVPFTAELDSLKAVVGDDTALNEPIGVLESQAASGVPSLIELRASFPAVARDVSRVHADWTGEDWVDKALSRVTSLVSVRKTGTDAMAAKGADGAIAQAEAALILGDVAAAVKALDGLEGPPAEAAAPWLAEARKRLDAEAALTALRQGAIALLATGG